MKAKEESSFCEQKEAKNFDPLSFGHPGLAAKATDPETPSVHSFFALLRLTENPKKSVCVGS
jgi:hypothetical protein